MDALEKVKLIVNRPDMPDELITIYIERAEADILGYCNREDMPEGCESSLIELAAFYISRQGIEGTTSYSEGGLSYGYSEGIPVNIRQRIQKFVRARVLPL